MPRTMLSPAVRVAEPNGVGVDRRGRALRVAIVAETFLPTINGVTNSVAHVATHMRQRGHEVMIIAPSGGPSTFHGCPVVRVPSVEVPHYRGMNVGRPSRLIGSTLKDYRPDVVHVAAPVLLGTMALRSARKYGIPSVATYQTDLPGFAERYGFGVWSPVMWRWVVWTHELADLTLAPSTAALWDLRHRGVTSVERWARGVDLERFDARHRCEALRDALGARDRVLVGYVGRLAKEKQVDRLAPLLHDPTVQLVIVGDGPARKQLERELPGAVFVGFKDGSDLGRHVASLDIFVHAGVDETFCQAIQEALASGVPVVAPAAGGPLDLVQHGVNGFLWNPLSPVALLGAVHELASSPLLRKRMGRAARLSVEGRTWTSIIDELEGHYLTTIGRLPAAHGAASR